MSEDQDDQPFEISARAPDGSRVYPLWFQDILLSEWGEGFVEKHLNFALVFAKRPRKSLLVTFDNLSNVRDRAIAREPWAYKFARDQEVSHLGVTSNVPNWFRDARLIARMQQLAKDGFFDGYDRVVFAGTSMGAFAAMSFAQLVPGSHVAAFNPQTTLDSEIVPWETRFEAGRRQDWTLPHSDAAQNLPIHAKVHLFFDPEFELDVQHIDRVQGENVIKYSCRYSGHKSALFLTRMGRMPDVMRNIVFGDLTETRFYQIYRTRRKLFWWRNILRDHFEKTDRTAMVEKLNKAFFRVRRQMGAAPVKRQADKT